MDQSSTHLTSLPRHNNILNWHPVHCPSSLVAQVGLADLSPAWHRVKQPLPSPGLLPWSERHGEGLTVLYRTWSALSAEPVHSHCVRAGGDSFSECLPQSPRNPVNLGAPLAAAKTASDMPYLLTERDLAQRVCLTRLTVEGWRKAHHSWKVRVRDIVWVSSNVHYRLGK